jgi:hypothetical protein
MEGFACTLQVTLFGPNKPSSLGNGGTIDEQIASALGTVKPPPPRRTPFR